MIVVGVLRLSGFFERLTGMALRRIRTPKGLLAVTIGLSGVLSAFLINDVVCVALTPLVLHLARRLKFDPVPHLIGLATAANIGSTGTITGNPQNIYIGIAFAASPTCASPRACCRSPLLGLGLDLPRRLPWSTAAAWPRRRARRRQVVPPMTSEEKVAAAAAAPRPAANQER